MKALTGLFITGTDTDVGKTLVTAALAASAQGPVAALKPVASGVPPGAAGEDAELLARAAGHEPRVHAALVAPISPHRAASLEGRSLELGRLVQWVRGQDAEQVLVEGVGGWAVPLAWSWGVPELAEALGLPVLLVAADRLGTLNHTLLSVGAIRARGLPLAGVVVNRGVGGASGEDPSRPHNLEDLRQLLPGLAVVPFPALAEPTIEALAAAGRTLREALGLP